MNNSIDESIGQKLRALRKMRNISLQQLANDTKMSYSFLSRLENGKHSISIVYLQKLANYFDVDLIYFLDNRESSVVIVRSDEELEHKSDDNISYSVITSKDKKYLQITCYELPKNSPSERNIHSHGEGQEVIVVIKGEVYVMVDGVQHRLFDGDSIMFNSEVEHTIFSKDSDSRILIISAPPYGRNI